MNIPLRLCKNEGLRLNILIHINQTLVSVPRHLRKKYTKIVPDDKKEIQSEGFIQEIISGFSDYLNKDA